jgi:hypothetical protein
MRNIRRGSMSYTIEWQLETIASELMEIRKCLTCIADVMEGKK